MKILVITNLFPNKKEPNRATFNKQQILALKAFVEKITVIAPLPLFKFSAQEVPLKETIEGIDVLHPRYLVIPKILRCLYGFFYFLGVWPLAKRLDNEEHFDIIFATWAYPDAFATALIAQKLQKPFVVKVHGTDINIGCQARIRRKMIAWALQKANKVIAVSLPLQEKIFELGVPKTNVYLLTNGVNLEKFCVLDRMECRRQLDITTQSRHVVFIGNLVLIKGVRFLIEALLDIPNEVCLDIIGDGPERGNLERLLNNLNLQNRIRFFDKQPHEKIPLWLNAADLLCLPSLMEGCPNVVLEAIACGTPVVATKVGGVPDLLRELPFTYLCKPQNPKDLAKRIRQGLSDNVDRERLRNAVIRMSWKENAGQLNEIFQLAVEQKTQVIPGFNNNQNIILKIFDQTVPYVSGYSMRSKYITDSLAKGGVPLGIVRSPIFSYEKEKEEIDGVRYYSSPPLTLFKGIPLLREWEIIRHIRQNFLRNDLENIGLIHAHSSLLNALAALPAARKKKIPFFYEVRALWEDAAVDQGKTKEGSLRYKLTRWLETYVLRKADHITTICEGLKADIVQRGIPTSKITVVPNGVDAEKFTPLQKDTELAHKLGLNGQEVIGFIGTFFEFEGIDILLHAVPEILKSRASVKFLIVGGGRHEDALKVLVTQLGIAQNIIFTGRVKHEEIKRYYSLIDILVYPRKSRRITELVTPLKPLEAMALEKLVIGSSVGGIKELVVDGENGLIFEKEKPSDLAKKCLFALEHPVVRDKIGKQAREYVLRERNWGQICKKYVNLYQTVGGL